MRFYSGIRNFHVAGDRELFPHSGYRYSVLDPLDYFWTMLFTLDIEFVVKRRELVRWMVKNQIPFLVDINVYGKIYHHYDDNNPVIRIWNEYWDYYIVVPDPDHELLIKLGWGSLDD